MSIKELKSMVNKKYGKDTLVLASEAHGLNITKFPTGSLAVDYMTGGLPRGRIIEVTGQEGSCKTTLCIFVAIEYLARHKDNYIVWVDSEGTFSPDWADKCGLDMGRVLLNQPDSGEQACDIVVESVEKGDECLVILDSIAATVPDYELENSTNKQTQGLHPRMINKFIRKVNTRLKKNLTDPKAPTATVITINQLREKLGMSFGDPRVAGGGKGKDFAYSTRLWTHQSTKIHKLIKGKKRFIGIRVGVYHKKSKVGGELFGKTEYNFYTKNTNSAARQKCRIDNYETAARLGAELGIVTKRGKGYKYRKLESKRGIDHFCDLLAEKPKTFKRLCDEIMKETKADEGPESTTEQNSKKSDSGKSNKKKTKRKTGNR